jgi:hypothetical protein
MSRSRASGRARTGGVRKAPARRPADPVQARLLAAIACVVGTGAWILPLPLGLAAILIAGWGVWRYGRTGFGVLALGGVTAVTVIGFAVGMAL